MQVCHLLLLSMPPVVAPMPVIPPAQAAQSPPEAWRLLFPAIQYHPEDRRAVLIRELIYGFTRAPGWAQLQAGLQRYGDGKFSLDISFRALHELCPIDDVSAALELQPLEGLACISAAAHQVGPQRSDPAGTMCMSSSLHVGPWTGHGLLGL